VENNARNEMLRLIDKLFPGVFVVEEYTTWNSWLEDGAQPTSIVTLDLK